MPTAKMTNAEVEDVAELRGVDMRVVECKLQAHALHGPASHDDRRWLELHHSYAVMEFGVQILPTARFRHQPYARIAKRPDGISASVQIGARPSPPTV
ncbi:MAG TPA: hypothetical protein VMP01_05635 [Pirellulaceae bacterium]|nr:hypothetical protein [Pirellulaceae bacterium]